MTKLSLLDVIDSRLGTSATSGDVLQLNEDELLKLAEALTQFYAEWRPPAPQEDEIRVFLPSHAHALYTDWHPGMPTPTPPVQQLLYVDALAVEDPASWATARLCGVGHAFAPPPHWSLVQREIAATVDAFRPCQQLIEGEALILTPGHNVYVNREKVMTEIYEHPSFNAENFEAHWHEFADFAAAEINTIAERFGAPAPRPRTVDIGWEWGSPYPIEPISSTLHGDGSVTENLFYDDSWSVTEDVLRGLGGAASARAQLLPHSLYVEACYHALVASMSEPLHPSSTPSPMTVGRTLVAGLLPFLTDLPPRTLVEIRENDESFAAWRADLRNAVRLIQTSPERPGFAAEAESVMHDMLMPRMDELRRSATVTSRLQRGTHDAAVAFAVGMLAGVATGDVTAGLAGAGTTASATLLLQALFPARPSGSQAVLLRLLPYVKKR